MSDEPKPFQVQSDGQLSRRENPDGSVSLTSNKDVALHIDSIKALGIENLVDVEVHTINRVFGSVSHYVKFFDGGEVKFSYNGTTGELLEFSATNVDAYVTNGERITLKMRSGDARKPG